MVKVKAYTRNENERRMDGLVFKYDKSRFLNGVAGIKYELKKEGFSDSEINEWLYSMIKVMK